MAVITLDVFSEVLNTGSDRLNATIRRRLSAEGRAFKERARRNASARFKSDTGATAGAVRVRLHPRRDQLEMGLDTSKSPGGLIQDAGGIIRPVKGRLLYIPQPDGSLRVARSVRIKATRWLSDAWEDTVRALPSALDGALSEALGVS